MLYDLLVLESEADICCDMDFLAIRRTMEKYCREDLAEMGKIWEKQAKDHGQ